MKVHFYIDLFRDVRRSLVNGRFTVALAILSMTVGIAATAVSLSVIDVVTVAACSTSLVDVLRIAPRLGRFMLPEEERRARQGSVAVISEGLWRREFGADQHVLGRTIRLDNRSFTIVGLMPSGLRIPPLPSPPAVWIPLGADPILDQFDKMFPPTWDRSAYLTLWARLGEDLDDLLRQCLELDSVA